MAAGDLLRPTKAQRAAIAAAVDRAETTTGLQVCVYLGTLDAAHSREHAEAMFVEQGLHERPAVLVLVAPPQRRVEVVVAPQVRDRIDDDAAAAAISAMTASFARNDLVGGLVAGLETLVERAGPGTAEPGAVELPDVLSDDDSSRP